MTGEYQFCPELQSQKTPPNKLGVTSSRNQNHTLFVFDMESRNVRAFVDITLFVCWECLRN